MLTRYALAMVFLRKRPLAHYNPKKFPLRGPKDALRAARYARGRRYAATRRHARADGRNSQMDVYKK